MKALGIATTILEILVLVSFATGQTTSPTPLPNPAGGAEEELTGLVSDAICKGMHFRKAHTPFSCTLQCVHDRADVRTGRGRQGLRSRRAPSRSRQVCRGPRNDQRPGKRKSDLG